MTAYVLAPSLLAISAVLTLVVFARRRLVVVHVTGRSMLPGLRPGDRVLVQRTAVSGFKLKPGDVVVLRAPVKPHWVIKRVAALPGDPVPASVRPATGRALIVPAGMLVVLADNPIGIDSRDWGFVRIGGLLGAVIWKFPG
jgi:signal peptidase I